jgi:hypothetical protein
MKIKGITVVFALFLFLATVHSINFQVVVTDDIGTLLVDFTTVEIMDGETVLFSKVTDHDNAKVSFDLAEGDYFLRLKRPGYPDHVYLKKIDRDEVFEAKMLRNSIKSTYTIFGKVISDDEEIYEGEKIIILREGAKWREYTLKSNGQYIFDTLLPQESYSIRIGSGDDAVVSAPFTYNSNGAFYIELDTKSREFTKTKDVLSGPQKINVREEIIVNIRAGEKFVADAQILVSTPDGEVVIYTDDKGIARLFAPRTGKYEFRYDDQLIEIDVVGNIEMGLDSEDLQDVQKEQNDFERLEKIELEDKSVEPSEEADVGFVLFGAGAAKLLMIGFLLFCLIVMVFAIYKLFLEKDEDKKTVYSQGNHKKKKHRASSKKH